VAAAHHQYLLELWGTGGAPYASIYVGASMPLEGITKSVALELANTGDSRERRRDLGPTDTGMLTAFTGHGGETRRPW